MLQHLIETLQIDGALTDRSRSAIVSTFSKVIVVRRREIFLRESEASSLITALVAGVAFRYKNLANGKRQILGIVMPGDLCDLSALYFPRLNYGVEAVTDCTIAAASTADAARMIAEHPDIGTALWRATMRNEAVLREWVVNLGRRPAHQRVAHFLCEFAVRTAVPERAVDQSLRFPLTQDEIADVTGLTVVHVNRVLQDLRAARIMTLERRSLTIHDWDRISAMAGFDAGYLRSGDANYPSTGSKA